MIPHFQPSRKTSPAMRTADRKRRTRRGARQPGAPAPETTGNGDLPGRAELPGCGSAHSPSPQGLRTAPRPLSPVPGSCRSGNSPRRRRSQSVRLPQKDNRSAFTAALLSGMANAADVVQFAPKQGRSGQNAGEAPPHNQISPTTQHGDFPRNMLQRYVLNSPLSWGVCRLSSWFSGEPQSRS